MFAFNTSLKRSELATQKNNTKKHWGVKETMKLIINVFVSFFVCSLFTYLAYNWFTLDQKNSSTTTSLLEPAKSKGSIAKYNLKTIRTTTNDSRLLQLSGLGSSRSWFNCYHVQKEAVAYPLSVKNICSSVLLCNVTNSLK